MKLFFFILSPFITLTAINAQVNPVKKDTTAISIGLVQSAHVCHRFTSSTSELKWMKENFDSIEAPMIQFSTAAIVNIDLTQKFQLNAGVALSKIGYQYKEGSLVGFTSYKERYQLIEIPLQAVYKLGTKKSFPFITLGATPGYVLNRRATYLIEDEKEETRMDLSMDISKFQVSASVSLGASITLSNSWNFRGELFYNQALTSISNGPLQKNLFSAGLRVGLFKSF